MHNAALTAVGLSDWHYEAIPVEPERLTEAVARIRGDDYAGANVTVPHKEAIIALIDGLTPVAEAIGAVNTIVKRVETKRTSPLLIGHNTDAAGLLADLHSRKVSVSNRPVVILGAGGAARAAVAACAGVVAEIRVISRRREQAESLQRIAPIEVFDWTPPGFLQACDDCALILNTTPLGMTPNTETSPWFDSTPFPPDSFVYDLVYHPAETRFVRQARAAGLRASTGLGMLIEQGALSFELWTGKSAPRSIMRAAAEHRLAHTRQDGTA